MLGETSLVANLVAMNDHGSSILFVHIHTSKTVFHPGLVCTLISRLVKEENIWCASRTQRMKWNILA